MKELKLEHLTPYFDHNLIGKIKGFSVRDRLMRKQDAWSVVGYVRTTLLCTRHDYNSDVNCSVSSFVPIFKPLPNYKDTNSESMKELNCDVQDQIEISELANGYISIHQVKYGTIKLMAKHHIDFNRLIEKGLAVEEK